MNAVGNLSIFSFMVYMFLDTAPWLVASWSNHLLNPYLNRPKKTTLKRGLTSRYLRVIEATNLNLPKKVSFICFLIFHIWKRYFVVSADNRFYFDIKIFDPLGLDGIRQAFSNSNLTVHFPVGVYPWTFLVATFL